MHRSMTASPVLQTNVLRRAHTRVLAALCLLTLASAPARALSFTSSCFASHTSIGEVAADFNEDGKLDVALSSAADDLVGGGVFIGVNLEVYLGHGDGTFGPAIILNGANAIGFIGLIATDANNDGHLDLVAANGQGFLSVFEGRGNGTFGARRNFGAGKASEGVAAGDLNGDGRMDLVSADNANQSVAVLLGVGQGGGFKSRVLYPSGFPSRAITTADLNGDGKLDVVTVNARADGGPGGTTLSVLLGNGDGTFQPFSVVTLPKFTGRLIRAADFDHDGRVDLVLGTQAFGTSGVQTLHGNGDGTFAPAIYYQASDNGTNLSATLYIDVGDINGDGNPDIATGNRRFSSSFLLTGADVTVLLGVGDGLFLNTSTTPATFGESVAIGDFNADGLGDVAVDGCVQLQNAPPLAHQLALAPAAQEAGSARLAVTFAPNPLRDRGRVDLVLPQAGRVSLGLYDLRGRRVSTVVEETWLAAGTHSFAIARSTAGLSPGVYFYRVLTPGAAVSGRLLVTER